MPRSKSPAGVKAAVDRRLFAGGDASTQAAPAAPGLLSSLAFWRTLATAALAALALYIALPFINPPVEAPGERLVASLAADGSDVRYLAVYDERANIIGLSRVAGQPAQGRDFELWVIEGQQAPVSLGVIPEGESARLPVGDAAARQDDLRRRVRDQRRARRRFDRPASRPVRSWPPATSGRSEPRPHRYFDAFDSPFGPSASDAPGFIAMSGRMRSARIRLTA